jgi:hypothetical protein
MALAGFSTEMGNVAEPKLSKASPVASMPGNLWPVFTFKNDRLILANKIQEFL